METSPENASREEALRLLKAGQANEAIAILEHLLAADSDDAHVHMLLGIAHNHANDRLHAIHHLEKSLRIQETPKAYYNLGLVYEASHRIDEAVRQFRMALELDPNYAHAHEALKKLQDRFEAERATAVAQTAAVGQRAPAPDVHPTGQAPAPGGPPNFWEMQAQKDREIEEQHHRLMKAGLIYGVICGSIFILMASFALGAVSLVPAGLISSMGLLYYVLVMAGAGAVYGGLVGFWVGTTCGGDTAGMHAGALIGAVLGLVMGWVGGAGIGVLIYMAVLAVISGIVGMVIGRLVEMSIE